MMCPQENAHLSMVRVSKHLHIEPPTLTDVLETKDENMSDAIAVNFQLSDKCNLTCLNRYVFVCLHIPTHKATNFTDLPMQIILLSVGRISNYNLGA